MSGGWKVEVIHQGEARQSQPSPLPSQSRAAPLLTPDTSLGTGMGHGPAGEPSWAGLWEAGDPAWCHWAGADGSRAMMWGPGRWVRWEKLQGLGSISQVL